MFYPAVNFCLMPQPPNTSVDTLDEDERRGWERGTRFMTVENAYAREHATRPATIGLILGSSPLALLSWSVRHERTVIISDCMTS